MQFRSTHFRTTRNNIIAQHVGCELLKGNLFFKIALERHATPLPIHLLCHHVLIPRVRARARIYVYMYT